MRAQAQDTDPQADSPTDSPTDPQAEPPTDAGETAVDVLVIGGGPAGATAARRASELGARVALVEAEHMGGTCVNTGCVPTRVLAKAARLMREVRTAGVYGIDTGEVRLDWPALAARVRTVISDVERAKDTAERLDDVGVQVIGGEFARFVDPHSVELEPSGRRVRFDTAVVSVGGHSRRLPLPGAEHAVFAEHLLELDDVPASVAIIGSGSTGAQLVTIFNAFGSDVTLMEVADRIMPTADRDVAATLTESFTGHGVEVITGIEGVKAIKATDRGYSVLASRGGWDREVRADLVVMAAGWPANLEGLGLEHAGVTVDRGAVRVNSYQQSNVPHIFVAGDATGTAMLVQSAESEGEVAAANAVLGPTRNASHGLLPWGGFTDPDVAGVGLTEEQARARDPRCIVATVAYSELERAIIDDRSEGFLKLIADRRRSMVLGAHAAGESAVEVIQAVATAMAAGVDVATLSRVEFAYPTYTAIVGRAAQRLLAA